MVPVSAYSKPEITRTRDVETGPWPESLDQAATDLKYNQGPCFMVRRVSSFCILLPPPCALTAPPVPVHLQVTSGRDGWAPLQHHRVGISSSTYQCLLGIQTLAGSIEEPLSLPLMSTGQALAGAARLVISRQRIYSDFGLTLPWPA